MGGGGVMGGFGSVCMGQYTPYTMLGNMFNFKQNRQRAY